jgi:hypothetical protein
MLVAKNPSTRFGLPFQTEHKHISNQHFSQLALNHFRSWSSREI